MELEVGKHYRATWSESNSFEGVLFSDNREGTFILKPMPNDNLGALHFSWPNSFITIEGIEAPE